MNKIRTVVLQWAALLGSAFIVLAIDQGAKAWVTSRLAFGESLTPIPALADYFALTPSVNRGAAFSIFPQAGDIFLIIALLMIGGILIFYRRIPAGHWVERIALGILLGGVSGNAIDRIRLGYVVDFVHLQAAFLHLSNVSNLADHAIVLAIAILFIVQWRGSPRQHPKSPDPVTIKPGDADETART